MLVYQRVLYFHCLFLLTIWASIQLQLQPENKNQGLYPGSTMFHGSITPIQDFMSLVPYLEMTLSKLQVLSDLVFHQLEEMGQWRTFGDPKAWYRYFRMKSSTLYHWMILNDLEGWIILTPAQGPYPFFPTSDIGPRRAHFPGSPDPW